MASSDEFDRVVKKLRAYFDDSDIHADDGEETITDNPGYGFPPIVAQIVYDAREADRRSSEGELESLDRTEIAAIATSTEEFTNHDGYIITYYIDGSKRSYFFDDIAVNELTTLLPHDGNVVKGYRRWDYWRWDEDPERTYHDVGWWSISLDEGDYYVAEDVVFGFETRPNVLQSLGTATYEGWWYSNSSRESFEVRIKRTYSEA